MSALFIDETGSIFNDLPPRLSSHLGMNSRSDLVEFALRNMGYAHVSMVEGGVRVKFRPVMVRPKAYAALMPLLYDRDPKRVLIEHFDQCWQHEIFGDVCAALNRITGLVRSGHDTQLDMLLSQELSCSSGENDNPLSAIVAGWQNGTLDFTVPSVFDRLSEAVSGRYVLFEYDEAKRTFAIRRVGPGMPLWARNCAAFKPDQPFTDFPDYRFAAACVKTYDNVRKSRRPRLESVDALIEWPKLGRLRRCYQRLLLPIQERSGRSYVLSASIDAPDIDLRRRAV